ASPTQHGFARTTIKGVARESSPRAAASRPQVRLLATRWLESLGEIAEDDLVERLVAQELITEDRRLGLRPVGGRSEDRSRARRRVTTLARRRLGRRPRCRRRPRALRLGARVGPRRSFRTLRTLRTLRSLRLRDAIARRLVHRAVLPRPDLLREEVL